MPSTYLLLGALLCLLELIQISVGTTVIGRLRRRTAVLRVQAHSDGLTGLANRRGLLHQYAQFARRQPPAVILLDLRRFKAINDQHGYGAGDVLLRQIADRLRTIARRCGGVAGRLGGDEFALLLPDADTTTLHDTITEIEQALRVPVALPYAAGFVQVAAVIGAAPPTTAPAEQPFRTADIALHHARHYRLPHTTYQPGMVFPAAEQRHGPRLRDLPGSPPAVMVDIEQLRWLTAGPQPSGRTSPDVRLAELLTMLNPRAYEFGAVAAELVDRCLANGVLSVAGPVTNVQIESSCDGEHLDGAFRVLLTFAGAVTLSSARIKATELAHPDVDPAEMLLGVVADTISELTDDYRMLLAREATR
ncbi:GGDEF domain-containing protein [Actinoplanes sp. NPDC000266]